MSRVGSFLRNTLVGGLLILLPVYLALLLLLKAVKVVGNLLDPVTALLPDWLRFKDLWSVVLILVFCFAIGALARTRTGRRIRERIEASLFSDLPGYAVFKGLTQQLTGQGQETAWKPALAEVEDALVPAFIVEQLDDGRFTVFVPSVPTPFVGTVYVLTPERVHPVNVPFTHALKIVSRWGSGA